MGGSNGKNGGTAFDFGIMRGVIIKIATSEGCPVDLSEVARAVAADFCPENEYPDEIIDALVKIARQTKAGRDAG
ncbi:hypothetical protein J1C56_32265 [Aminobacter anthyllidis]|uniref:Uncharacterized protein n=1 Tax=Aminobacter anthyllidis TaxID=1035067 RepID=A0A9X1AJ76_9HYPH|nr:hypothetical protein [Aminobacter anthyllidis]MBT1160206.1 hypothetical protein [Aminobacter anthyllidis]